MTISCRDHIQDWSIARVLSSVTHDTVPYFLVNGGQDFHGLLLQTSTGLRKYFLCPCTPFGQQGILCATARKGDNGRPWLPVLPFIWEVMWHWTWKVLYLYGFLQKRHLGCCLSQAAELFLWRSSTQNVLRSSSSSVSCSGGVVCQLGFCQFLADLKIYGGKMAIFSPIYIYIYIYMFIYIHIRINIYSGDCIVSELGPL